MSAGPDPSICGRCLTLVDARSAIAAEWHDDEHLLHTEFFDAPGNPARFKAWIDKIRPGRDVTFRINDASQAVIAVTTFQGDPVCAMHAIEAYHPRRF